MVMIACPMCLGAGILTYEDAHPATDRRWVSSGTFTNTSAITTVESCSSPGMGHECAECGGEGEYDDGA